MKSEEIAKLAGVSRSTVSRVVNNYKNVPKETRDKVMQVIEQYNYVPNTMARALAGKGTNTIGLFIVSVSDKKSHNRIYQNNYFAPFVDAVIDLANQSGFYVLVHTIYEKKDFLKITEAFSQKRIDGGIIIGTEKNTETINRLINADYPLVIIDYDFNEILSFNTQKKNVVVINSSDYEGTADALNYLISLGHKKIGFISGRTSTFSGKQRLKAYKDTIKKNNLLINDDFILKGDFIKEKTRNSVQKLIDSKNLPTAILSSNDDMALVAMDVFENSGIKIPDDISIAGFDDVPFASQVHPALTTVRLPVYLMAEKAIEFLSIMIKKDTTVFTQLIVSTKLIIRESCRELISD